jgi:(2R)-3-sulfolactate dehydrogenase (NADP+)
LVALFFANGPAAMAPWGGKTAVFGTNPIAFACPLPRREPIVVDLSLSKVARGNVMAAAKKGEPIPEGWALDVDGRPTTDANAALAGTMVPLGDAKGTALALMVELIAAGLTGSNFAAEASSYFDAEGPPSMTGQFIIALDPAVFASGVERFAVLARSIEEQQGARLPGMRRYALRKRAEAEGLTVRDALLAELKAL